MDEKGYDQGSQSLQALQKENSMLRAQVDRQAQMIGKLEETVDGYLYQILTQKCQILRAQIKDKEDQLIRLEEQLKVVKHSDQPVNIPDQPLRTAGQSLRISEQPVGDPALEQEEDDEITKILKSLRSDSGKSATSADTMSSFIPKERAAQQPDKPYNSDLEEEKSVAADEPVTQPAKKKSLLGRILGTVGNVVFYVALAFLLVGAFFIRSAQSGAPLNIAGYSGMLVLSGSMQDVLPKGSFLLTKSVDADTLAVGDDITFMTNSTTSVTHRIIEILPQPDGTLSFRTQGTNNTTADANPVSEVNIVGKVIYHNYRIGMVAQWISDNWPILVFLLAVWIILGFVLRRLNSGKGENQGEGNETPDQEKGGRFGKAAKKERKKKTDGRTLVGVGR